MRLRLALGALGVAGVVYGAVTLLAEPDRTHPLALAVWLAVAVAVHDGLIVPLTLLVGAVLARWVPPRARRYVQGAMVAGALVTASAVPLIIREGQAPEADALLTQDYASNLALLLAVIAVGAAGAYALRVVRDRRAVPDRANG